MFKITALETTNPEQISRLLESIMTDNNLKKKRKSTVQQKNNWQV